MSGLWLLLALAAGRPADAASSLLLTNSSMDTSSSGVAQTVRAAESPALPAVMDALERARTLGVDNATYAGAEATAVSRAAADLSLLSELTAVASSHLPHAAPSLKAALASSDAIDVQRILDAFTLAERANVPPEEVQAARQALDEEISERLTLGVAALGPNASGSLASRMEDLAHNIQLAIHLSYEGDIQTARNAFTATLEANLDTTDMDFVERMAAVADISNSRVPNVFHQWAGLMRSMREALNKDENKTESLPHLMRVVTRATEAQLPASVPEFVTVKAKAQACCLLALDAIMAGLDPNSTSADPGVTDALLAQLENAKSLSIPSASTALATSKVQALASSELQTVLAPAIPDISDVRAAFDKVTHAGVSAAEIDSKRLSLDSKIQALLGSATTAMGMTVSAENVEALAQAVDLAVAFDVNGTGVADARSLYKAAMAGPVNTSSTSVFEALVQMAEQAGVGVPKQMQEQFDALKSMQQASAKPACQVDNLLPEKDFLAAFRRSRDAQLPSYPSVLDVQAKLQSCAIIKLNNTAVDVRSIDVYLGLLDTAREVGVPEASLVDAVNTIQAVTSAYINDALARNPVDADEVHDAFVVVERAGMSASEISAKASALVNQTQARLQAAQSTLSSSNSSSGAIEAMKELAMAIAVGVRVAPVEEALKPSVATARALYESKLNIEISSSDLDFLKVAVDYADFATVGVPERIHRVLRSARELHEAVEKQQEDLPKLLNLLAESESASTPLIEDKIAIQNKAKQKAQEELEAAVGGDNFLTLKQALTVAVQVGVSESSLNEARTVLNAL